MPVFRHQLFFFEIEIDMAFHGAASFPITGPFSPGFAPGIPTPQSVSYPIPNFIVNQTPVHYPSTIQHSQSIPLATATDLGGPNGKGFEIKGPKEGDRRVSEEDCKTLGIPVGSLFGAEPVEDYYPYGEPGAYGTPVQPDTIQFMNSEAYTGEVRLPLHVLKGMMWGTGAVPIPWGQKPH